MALPPESGDTFLREVDENLRRDELQNFAKKYAGWLIGALILFLVAVGGWLYWQEHQRSKSAEQSEIMADTYQDVGRKQMANVPQRLDALAEDGGDAVRASALFARAAVAIDQNDRKLALQKYREIAEDKGLAQPHRDLALLRATTLEFDSIKPEEVIARLQPLVKPGEPWYGSAGELTAMAYIKQGKKAEAGRLFAAIAADKQVPDSIRARAVQIAGTLGVDASASLPASAQ